MILVHISNLGQKNFGTTAKTIQKVQIVKKHNTQFPKLCDSQQLLYELTHLNMGTNDVPLFQFPGAHRADLASIAHWGE